MVVFKILLEREWTSFRTSGRFDGSPLDLEDGFVHCSSRAQVASTARRFFSDTTPLVIVAVDMRLLGNRLRWERAADRELFPHVYGPLHEAEVVSVHRAAGAAQVAEILERTG
jgi:uncharacterized protein (DUF952 family)